MKMDYVAKKKKKKMGESEEVLFSILIFFKRLRFFSGENFRFGFSFRSSADRRFS